MALFRKFFYRKPPDGLLEISERVYVFDCCFTTDAFDDSRYRSYTSAIVSNLKSHFPEASFMVFNFREESPAPSLLSSVLSAHDMTVMDYPRHYSACPILALQMVHHFLRSGESWLGLGAQNVILMHCERGGWPVLAFMLAALLVYRKQYGADVKTLDMVYKQAPRELLQLICPLNPLPSQLRYLGYISRRNVGDEWPPRDRALTLDCVILREIPGFNGEAGCRPVFRVYGMDPLQEEIERNPKLLYATNKRSKLVRLYKQVDCDLIKLDIRCHIQGDVVLECINLEADLEREEMMFRVMFNTAFIRSNILMLNRDQIDILWDAKDRFPKDFRAEVLLSELDTSAQLFPPTETSNSNQLIEKEGLPIEAFARVQEIFSDIDWLGQHGLPAQQILRKIGSSNSVLERLDPSISPTNREETGRHRKALSLSISLTDETTGASKSVQAVLDSLSPLVKGAMRSASGSVRSEDGEVDEEPLDVTHASRSAQERRESVSSHEEERVCEEKRVVKSALETVPSPKRDKERVKSEEKLDLGDSNLEKKEDLTEGVLISMREETETSSSPKKAEEKIETEEQSVSTDKELKKDALRSVLEEIGTGPPQKAEGIETESSKEKSSLSPYSESAQKNDASISAQEKFETRTECSISPKRASSDGREALTDDASESAQEKSETKTEISAERVSCDDCKAQTKDAPKSVQEKFENETESSERASCDDSKNRQTSDASVSVQEKSDTKTDAPLKSAQEKSESKTEKPSSPSTQSHRDEASAQEKSETETEKSISPSAQSQTAAASKSAQEKPETETEKSTSPRTQSQTDAASRSAREKFETKTEESSSPGAKTDEALKSAQRKPESKAEESSSPIAKTDEASKSAQRKPESKTEESSSPRAQTETASSSPKIISQRSPMSRSPLGITSLLQDEPGLPPGAPGPVQKISVVTPPKPPSPTSVKPSPPVPPPPPPPPPLPAQHAPPPPPPPPMPAQHVPDWPAPSVSTPTKPVPVHPSLNQSPLSAAKPPASGPPTPPKKTLPPPPPPPPPAPGPPPPPPPPPTPGPPPPPPPPSAPAPPPPPRAPGPPPPPPPRAPGPPPPPSAPGPPPPPRAPGPPPPPGAPGPPRANGAGPPPPPNGVKGGPMMKGKFGASRSSQGQQVKKNLKPLHWVKVTRAMQGSLWAEAPKSDDSRGPVFDMAELECLFSAALPSADSKGSDKGRNSAPKNEKIHLIDLRRANNCGIMLTKVKMPLSDLMSAILALDDSVLDGDQVENLIKFTPTKEEIELLKGFSGNKESLGECERYFLELMKLPRVESKLRVFLFKIQFRSQVSDLRKNLTIVNSCAEEIKESTKFKRIMQTILSLGNALNQGTARGSAVGFRLDSLLKLSDTRARNNKMTLMHYLCKVLAEKLPELLDFHKDLISLDQAAKIQLKSLAEEMQAINKGLEKVEQELTTSENDGPVSHTFRKTLKEFLSVAEADVRTLTSLYSTVGRNADALARYFGEDPARCSFEQVVSTLLNFVRLFFKAHEENCKQIELEKKKAMKAAQENEKIKPETPKRTVDSPFQSSVKKLNT